MGLGERARGGTGGLGRLGAAGLIEVVVRDGIGLGGIERGCLIEVVRGVLLGDLVGVGGTGLEGELGLGPPAGGVEEGREGGLADADEISGDALGVGENPSEAEFVEG